MNQSLTTGIFPKKIKIAKVFPLYKNSDATSIANYRPISLLTARIQILEKAIFQQINYHFTDTKLFNKSNKHSTE